MIIGITNEQRDYLKDLLERRIVAGDTGPEELKLVYSTYRCLTGERHVLDSDQSRK